MWRLTQASDLADLMDVIMSRIRLGWLNRSRSSCSVDVTSRVSHPRRVFSETNLVADPQPVEFGIDDLTLRCIEGVADRHVDLLVSVVFSWLATHHGLSTRYALVDAHVE